jgi:YidC/Oxa1 family membrane protein insertase
VDNRRLVLCIVLSVIVVAAWQYLFPPPRVTPRPADAIGGSAAPAAGGAGMAANSAAQTTGSSPAGAAAVPAGGQGAQERQAGEPSAPGAGGAVAPAVPAAAVPAGPPIGAAAEERVVLEIGGTRATFSNRGAQMESLVATDPGTASVELVRRRSQGPYPYGLVDKDQKALPINDALFAVERGKDGRSATFRYRGPAGNAEKTFGFDDKGLLAVEVKASGKWGVVIGPGIGNPTAAELDNRYGQRDAVVKAAGDVKALTAKGESETKVIPARDLSWAGLEDTFFAAVAVPQGGSVARALLEPVLVERRPEGERFSPVPAKDDLTKEQKDLSREYRLILQPVSDTVVLECYWGSKRYERLKALPYGLDETVKLGWLRFVVLPLLSGLHWIYEHIVANYGWAIILMTVLIKLILLPLTHQSTMSMRKMQVLNPKMQSIRERYRPKLKDKQGRPNLDMQRKMNEEIMALYKVEGVNPAGGCLPLLIQMPILFAFYRLLSTSVDLHNAPWMLWIHDLSAQDPYFILPLVMGATQFAQVFYAPQSGDPAQRRLFLLMPLFMLVFFLSAPSGLVLYWLTNNVLTIAQQAVYNRFWKLESAQ